MMESLQQSDALQRTSLLLGDEAVEKLTQTRIGIMGLGGVGTYAAEILARTGIGHFVLVDFDRIKPSNINRQLTALHSTIGMHKTDALRQRILDINPNAAVECHADFCDQPLREKILPGLDYVIDAIDSLGPKTGLLEDAFNLKIPIISVMGAGGKLDPSKIRMSDLSKTTNCPLARRVRKYLKRRGIEKGIPVIYSSEIPQPQHNHDAGSEAEWEVDRGRKRGTLGTVGYLPAIMGMWAASVVIRAIAGDAIRE